jgi:hypothetical protein
MVAVGVGGVENFFSFSLEKASVESERETSRMCVGILQKKLLNVQARPGQH